MKKMTYSKLKEIFREYEKEYYGTEKHLTGYIVFAESSFKEDGFIVEYSKESRTYVVSSDNKAFQPNKGGYSIFGSCLDGTDKGVRLDQYMAEENGGQDGWVVDYCYMEDEG